MIVSGNPAIFTPTRRLLKEIEIEKIKLKTGGGEVETKAMVAHIFNDVFIYSRRTVRGGFKLQHMILFENANFSRHDISGLTLCFSLMYPDSSSTATGMSSLLNQTMSVRMNQMKTETFRLLCDREEDAIEIFGLIARHIDEQKAKQQLELAEAVNNSKRMSTITTVAIQGVKKDTLGPRLRLVYDFLMEEYAFAEQMNWLNNIMIQPLLDASKGAPLKIIPPKGMIGTNNPTATAAATSTEETLTKYQINAITEALQEADILIFLRATEQITIACKEFVKSLEALCQTNKWSEVSTLIGQFFTSVSAKSLYNQYKLYCTGQQALIRVIMKDHNFQTFRNEVNSYLSSVMPGTIPERLELARQRIPKYTNFLRDLQLVTLKDHLDANHVTNALQIVYDIERELEEVQRLKNNFEKLLDIQSSIVTISNEPIITKLASMDRQLLLVQDLKKVCRKKNKVFRFWCFHDYLIYGSALGNEKYSFNRALELVKCSVVKSNNVQCAFEIYGAEKSFVVITPDQESCNEWVQTLSTACDNIKRLNGIGYATDGQQQSGANEVAVAPLWQPDHNSDICTQCNKAFTFWNRRHHCRKCGALVCSDHLKHREIIPHISKTIKHKICDNCVKGITPSLQIPIGSGNVGEGSGGIDGENDNNIAIEEVNPVKLERLRKSGRFVAPLIPASEVTETEIVEVDLPALPPPPVPTHAPPAVPTTAAGAGAPPAIPSSEPVKKKSLFTKRRSTMHGKLLRYDCYSLLL